MAQEALFIGRRVRGKSRVVPKAKEQPGKRGKAKAKAKEQPGKRGKAAPKAKELLGKCGKAKAKANPKTKAKSAKRKPKQQCDLEDVFCNMDDLYECASEAASTEPDFFGPGEEGIEDLEEDGEDGEDDAEQTKDAFYEVVSSMVNRLPIDGLLQLIRNWKLLAQKGSVDMGSGCTGSGLDSFAMKIIGEVLAACLDARSLQRERRDVCFVVSFCLQMLLT